MFYTWFKEKSSGGPIVNGLIIQFSGNNYNSIMLMAPLFMVCALILMWSVRRGEDVVQEQAFASATQGSFGVRGDLMKIVKDTPDIETRRLLLKEVCIEDAADIYAYTLNPNVLRFTTGRPPKAFSETETFVRGLVGKPAGDFAWAIRTKTGSAVIGVIELDIRERSSASLDYALAERYWNQGIMTEAARALLDWAFRTYPTLESLHSSALSANPASTRVQQKCGMQFQKTETQTWSKFDEPVELAFYSISRAEWTASTHS